MIVYLCNTRNGDTKEIEPLEFSGQSVNPGFRNFVLKNKIHLYIELRPSYTNMQCTCAPHRYTCTHKNIHIHEHMYTRKPKDLLYIYTNVTFNSLIFVK